MGTPGTTMYTYRRIHGGSTAKKVNVRRLHDGGNEGGPGIRESLRKAYSAGPVPDPPMHQGSDRQVYQ